MTERLLPISVILNRTVDETVSRSEAFYAAATVRIVRFMIALAVIGFISLAVFYGWRTALGFACGAAVSTLNFHWLKRVVSALADRATQSGEPQSSKGVVLRFLLRYFLMAVAAYAIFTVTPASLNGLFAGLFLPVAAIFGEAAYEAYAAIVRGL